MLASASIGSAADPKDPLAHARTLYNQRQFDAAIAAADVEGRRTPDRADSADLIVARAYLERGRWHRRLATRGLWEKTLSRVRFAKVPKGASMDNAVRDLEKAVELAPQAIEARMELARVYLALERGADARRELERAIGTPVNRPRDPGLQAEAKVLLEKLTRRG